MKTDSPEGGELPAATAELVRQFIEEHIPFNRYLGMKCGELRHGFARLEIPFRDELVGDPFRPALHGGVISALADTVGGCAVFTAIEPGERCSTIDIRVDYLRPGRLEKLTGEAEILRVGGRVAVTSMTIFHDDPKRPIAVAKGVYSVKRFKNT
jgi:uncharacterized protein (TIGR00369 family)